jgi:hypothetical protein
MFLIIIYVADDEIKAKWESLRSGFMREMRKVSNSKKSDQLYVSRWAHYKQLMFLMPVIKIQTPRVSNLVSRYIIIIHWFTVLLA